VAADAYPSFSICGIPYYVSGEVRHWSDLTHRTLAERRPRTAVVIGAGYTGLEMATCGSPVPAVPHHAKGRRVLRPRHHPGPRPGRTPAPPRDERRHRREPGLGPVGRGGDASSDVRVVALVGGNGPLCSTTVGERELPDGTPWGDPMVVRPESPFVRGVSLIAVVVGSQAPRSPRRRGPCRTRRSGVAPEHTRGHVVEFRRLEWAARRSGAYRSATAHPVRASPPGANAARCHGAGAVGRPLRDHRRGDRGPVRAQDRLRGRRTILRNGGRSPRGPGSVVLSRAVGCGSRARGRPGGRRCAGRWGG
jgi:hypothetical protein